MAYTYEQLTKAYTAVHGIEPTGEAASQLRLLTNASFTDTQRLSYILNSADTSTSVAVLSYQFFTGKAPSAEGMDYLLKSGATNLNSETYAKFNLENRFMNFATNLALQGEGKAAFEASYGSMTYAQYVASIYESIIGKAQATAAGLNVEQTIQSIIARQDLILLSARNNGVIGPNATQAEIDLALKAATAAYLLAEGIKADVGVYAGATNNFMVGLATGKASYGTDILTTHAPTPGSDSSGVGQTIDNPPAFEELPGAPAPTPEPEGPTNQTFTLSISDDIFKGGTGDDTFDGTDLTFTNGDHLDGGAGDDTLTVTVTGGGVYNAPNSTVENIESVTLNSDGAVNLDVEGWGGLTQLNTTSVGQLDLNVASATNIDATIAGQDDDYIIIRAGNNVTLNITGATTGLLYAGYNSALQGDVVVNRELTGASAGGNIQVTGGKTVSVTQTVIASPGQTHGAVFVDGSAATTSVTAKATPAGAGLNANQVFIVDVHYNSATEAGTITKASIDGYTTLTFSGTALSDLTLANGSGNIILDNRGLTVPTNKTLNLTVSGLSGGTLDDADVYETLNITTGASASTLANVTLGHLKTLAIAGTSTLTLTSAAGMTALETVTLSGAAGLSANLSGATVTSVSTAASTGTSTLTIDASKASFAGGAGVDNITLSSTTVSQSVTLGGGDNILTLASGTTHASITGLLEGTSGGNNALKLDALDAAEISGYASAKFYGFQTIELTAAGTADNTTPINLGQISGIADTVRTQGGNGLTLNGATSVQTLELTGAGTSYNLSGNWTAPNTALTVKLNNSDMANRSFGTINAAEVEDITIESRGADSTIINSVTLAGDDVKTVTLSGNASIDLTAASGGMTTVDASAMTGDFSWTAGPLGGLVTVKGSATGTNTVDLSTSSASYDYVGGAGSDNVTLRDGQNFVDLGSGVDHVTFTQATFSNAAPSEITGFGLDDQLTLDIATGQAAPTSLVHLQGETTLAAYIAAATAGSASSALQWFTFGGDAYLVQDRSANNYFSDGVDVLVKLVGVTDLNDWVVNSGTLEHGGS